MLRNAAKKVDLPLQLKKAKEMLFSVQEQLATAKQETLRRAVQTGVGIDATRNGYDQAAGRAVRTV